MRGIVANTRVQALAKDVKGEAWTKQKFPDTWETQLLPGTAVEKAGGRTWAIAWDHEELARRNIATRFLHPEGGGQAEAAGASC